MIDVKSHFPYSDNNKRYHTLTYFYKQKFHEKICKVSLNASFTCPNIDGKVGYGGCVYCSKLGSGEFAGKPGEDLETQFEKGKKMMQKKWPNAKFIAYFQAHTNTYAPVSYLKKCFEPFVEREDVVGIAIATRSDAISDACLAYLKDLNKRTFLMVELGLQTVHDETAKRINRCSTYANFKEMVKKLREAGIMVIVHIINGLPFETEEMMIETAKELNQLDIQGIKIHMLQVLRNTALEKWYQKEPFPLLSLEEYVDITVKQLEYLRPNIVIHRITGDPVKEDLIAPEWVLKKFCVMNEIDKKMAKEDLMQGDLLAD